jgi:hypothetical protein
MLAAWHFSLYYMSNSDLGAMQFCNAMQQVLIQPKTFQCHMAALVPYQLLVELLACESVTSLFE